MAERNNNKAKWLRSSRDDTAGGSHLKNVQSHYFLRSEDTEGAFSLTEILFQPGASGTPMHIHTREEETYYVIEGELLVCVGEEEIVFGPGGSILLPRNLKHKVAPASDRTTRVPMIITPPGLESMLMKLDQSRPGELDMKALLQLSSDYGIQILPNE